MSKTKNNAAELSVSELEKLLAEKKASEMAEKKEKRAAYEAERDVLVDELASFAWDCEKALIDLKTEAFMKLLEFKGKMLDYGALRNGPKNRGNFELKTAHYKVSFSSQIVKKFDERANLAEAKLHIFLSTTIKKRDRKLYDFISSLMQRKEDTGEFDHDMISRLYKIEDDYTDSNWVEAIKLFKESYCPVNTNQYVRFARALPTGGWEAIILDFAKLKTAIVYETETAEAQ